jgi:Type I restriction enzyme R protein N terminus (HSDR_N)
MPAIQAETLTLYDLEQKFSLQQHRDRQFFTEWQEPLPPLTDLEKQRLTRTQEQYFHLSSRPILEEMVKMVIVSPLLDLAGFYNPPFYPVSEKSVKLSVKDEQATIRSKIDVLVIQDQLWVLVIEAKRSGLSLEPGIPQALTYMLASPQRQRPLYGMVTNGSNFIFLKLTHQKMPSYSLSEEFTLRRSEDLFTVMRVLKQLADTIHPIAD